MWPFNKTSETTTAEVFDISNGVQNPMETRVIGAGRTRKLNNKPKRTLAVCGIMLLVAVTLSGVAVTGEVAHNVMDNAEMIMSGGAATLRYRPAKGSKKGNSKKTPPMPTSGTEGDTAAQEDAPDGSTGDIAAPSSSFRRPKSTRFNSIGRGSSVSPQPLGVALIRQMPTTGLTGLDGFYLPGFVGTPNVSGGITTAPKAFISVQKDSSGVASLKVNPRAYQILTTDRKLEAQDRERLSAYSPGSYFGRLLAYLKERTSLWSEMNPALGNEGYLMHWMQTSYQTGLWMRRAVMGLYIEQEAMKGRAGGKAGITSEHNRTPYARLYEEIKPLFTRESANLDLTLGDYTIQQWFEGFLKRIAPSTLGGLRAGMSRPHFVLHSASFNLGLNSDKSGYMTDSDGNPSLVMPIFNIQDAMQVELNIDQQTSDYGFGTYASETDNLTIDESSQTFTDEGLSTATIFAGTRSVDMPDHTERYKAIRTKANPNYDAKTIALDDANDYFDYIVQNNEILPDIDTIVTLDSLVGPFWSEGKFVGGHNLLSKLQNSPVWDTQQTLLNATPDELIAELEFWNREYPQMVQEYQDALGVTQDPTAAVAAYMTEADFFTHEINLYGKYGLKFNPRHAGEWHDGPGMNEEISELYYERTALPADSIADNMFLKYSNVQIMCADGTRGVADGTETGMLKFVDNKLLNALCPTTSSMGKKGERAITIPAGLLVEGVPYNGATDIGGSQWIQRMVHGMNHAGLEYGERYPCTDLNFDSAQFSDLDGSPIVLEPLVLGATSRFTNTFMDDDLMLTEALLNGQVRVVDIDSLHDGVSKMEAQLRENELAWENRLRSKAKKDKEVNTAYWAPPIPNASWQVSQAKVSHGASDYNLSDYVTLEGESTEVTFLTEMTTLIGEDGVAVLGGSSNFMTQFAGNSVVSAPLVGNAAYILVPEGHTVENTGNMSGGSRPFGDMTFLGNFKPGPTVVNNTNFLGLMAHEIQSIWLKAWASVHSGSNPMTAEGLKFSLKPQGTATEQPVNSVHLNYVKLRVDENGEATLSGPPESIAILQDQRMVSGTFGQLAIAKGDPKTLPQAMAKALMDEELTTVSFRGARDRTAYTFDIFWHTVSGNGQLLNTAGNALFRVPKIGMAISYVAERFGSTSQFGEANGPQALQHLRITTEVYAFRGSLGSYLVHGTTKPPGGFAVAQLTQAKPVLRPARIVPNGVRAFFHPELELGDAAVLYHSTDPRHRFAWQEGQMSLPFHGEMQPFRHGILTRMGTEAADELKSHETNPLTRPDVRGLRMDVVRLDGIVLGRTVEEQKLAEMIASLNFPAITRALIYDVEEAARYS